MGKMAENRDRCAFSALALPLIIFSSIEILSSIYTPIYSSLRADSDFGIFEEKYMKSQQLFCKKLHFCFNIICSNSGCLPRICHASTTTVIRWPSATVIYSSSSSTFRLNMRAIRYACTAIQMALLLLSGNVHLNLGPFGVQLVCFSACTTS